MSIDVALNVRLPAGNSEPNRLDHHWHLSDSIFLIAANFPNKSVNDLSLKKLSEILNFFNQFEGWIGCVSTVKLPKTSRSSKSNNKVKEATEGSEG